MPQSVDTTRKKRPQLRIVPEKEEVFSRTEMIHNSSIGHSITKSSFDEITTYYDTVFNMDKSTYVSSNDEPTPMNCVKELIDTIPTDFWKTPNLQILDHCCGNGNFGVHLYHKLVSHHSTQTILENIL